MKAKLILVILYLLAINSTSIAKEEIKLTSDTVEYSGIEQKILEAKGNVHITKLNETIIADTVKYNTVTEKVEASGHIKYTDGSGDVITSDHLEIDGDFKHAIIHQLMMKTAGGATIKAKSANKIDENHYQLKDAFYTPCKICGDKNPIWSFRASDVNFDSQNKHLDYKDVKFYAAAIPIFYLPYFAHPTKGAKRKSGILRMGAGYNSNTGTYIRIPYYFNLSPDRDATITFIPTAKSNVIFEGEYRHLTDYGMFTANSIFTKPSLTNKRTRDFTGKTRYNIRSQGDFYFSKDFNLDYGIDYTSDRNFLRTYKYNPKDYTRSNISTNYYQDRNYFKSEALYFQNLREGQSKDCNPLVLPHLMGYYESYIGDSDFKYYNNSDFLYFHKNSSHTINRVSLNNGIKKNIYTDNGHYFELKTNLRTDMYYYNIENTLPGKADESDQNRVVPTIQSEWHYPNYTYIDTALILVEPIIQAKISPARNNNKNIYNEDSKDSELSFSNLFAESKFTGLDLVERGTRLNYGIKTNAFVTQKMNIALMIGQSYSTQKYHISDLEERDFDKKLSNYVGLLRFNYDNRYILSSKFKLDYKKYAITNNELTFEYRTQPLYFTTEFVSYKDYINQISLQRQGRKELNFEIGTSYIKDWQFSVKARNNLNKRFSQDFKRGLINLESNISYFYDCIGFNVKIYRDFTNPIGTKPANGFFFHVTLKNLNG